MRQRSEYPENDKETLMVFCSGAILLDVGKGKVSAGDAAESSVEILAQKENITLGEARSRLLALKRKYGGWTGVTNECIDRGWFIQKR